MGKDNKGMDVNKSKYLWTSAGMFEGKKGMSVSNSWLGYVCMYIVIIIIVLY